MTIGAILSRNHEVMDFKFKEVHFIPFIFAFTELNLCNKVKLTLSQSIFGKQQILFGVVDSHIVYLHIIGKSTGVNSLNTAKLTTDNNIHTEVK